MISNFEIDALRDEERLARVRLDRFKAKLYVRPELNSADSRKRLGELQRQWEHASARLRAARVPHP